MYYCHPPELDRRIDRSKPLHFLDFTKGEGYAIVNEEDFTKSEEDLERETQKVAPDALAIKGLGQFERFKAANAFRQLIEQWHVSDFHISAARGRKDASGDSEHLSETGDNLPLVARTLHERHTLVFQRILDTMARRVPGVSAVESMLMDDGYQWLTRPGARRDLVRNQVAQHRAHGGHAAARLVDVQAPARLTGTKPA